MTGKRARPSRGRFLDRAARPVNQEERRILERTRLFLVAQAAKCNPDRLAWLITIAFRQEFPQSALGNAYARGIAAHRNLLRMEGGSISEGEAAQRLGVSLREVKRLYRSGSVLGFRDQKRVTRYPIWQFDTQGLLSGITDVLQILAESKYVDDIGRLLFFLSNFEILNGRRPLDCLRRGDVHAAIRVARCCVQ